MRSCVERYVYSVYILSLLLLFFVSFRFCRGSLNRSMCCCCWCTRSTSFAICRFVSSISYARAFTFAFIKNYGMRWNGTRDVNVGLTRSLSLSPSVCVCTSYAMRIIVVVLVGQQNASMHLFYWWGSLTDTILKLLPMLRAMSHANSSACSHTPTHTM